MSLNLANIIISTAISLCGTGVGVALLQGVFSRDGRRAEAAKTAAEGQAQRHEIWFNEAQAAYDRVNKECSECKQELAAAEKRHQTEINQLRREVGDLKDAVISRIDDMNEVLPYVQGMPDDKVREIRAANRAVKMAIWGHT